MKYIRLTLTSIVTVVALAVLFFQVNADSPKIHNFSLEFDQGSEEVFKNVEITGQQFGQWRTNAFSYVNKDLLHTGEYNILQQIDSKMAYHSRKEDEIMFKHPELFRSHIYDGQYFENEDYYFSVTSPNFYEDEIFDKSKAPMKVKMLNKKTDKITEFSVPRETEYTNYTFFNVLGAYYEAPHLYILTNNNNYSDNGSQDSLIISHYNTETKELVETVESDPYPNTTINQYAITKDPFRTCKQIILEVGSVTGEDYTNLVMADLVSGTFSEVKAPKEAYASEGYLVDTVYQSSEGIYLINDTDPKQIKVYPLEKNNEFAKEPIVVPIQDSLINHTGKKEPVFNYEMNYASSSSGGMSYYQKSIIDGKLFIQASSFSEDGRIPFQVYDLNARKQIASGNYKIDASGNNDYDLGAFLIQYYPD